MALRSKSSLNAPMRYTYLTVLFLFCCGRHCVFGDLTIELEYTNLTLKKYEDLVPFRVQYANIRIQPGTLGLLHQPVPRNGCSYIQPLPWAFTVNYTIIALIDDYPGCVESMIENVRNAGYNLIIASGQKRTVTKEVQNSGFPVTVVDQDYADYLRNHTLISSYYPDVEAVEVTITGNVLMSIFVMALGMPFFMLTCCICCVCVCCCIKCKRERDFERRLWEEIEEDPRLRYDPARRRDRQELVESILRQLAELQVDMQGQIPLGEQATKQLPSRPYKPGNEINDSCVICVEEFSEGDSLRILPCDHAFHIKCVDEWLINHSALCPLCKAEVHHEQNLPQGNRSRPTTIQVMMSDDSSSEEDSKDEESLLLNNGIGRSGSLHV